jgi:aryl-alcohol dehydrogenase-like predicted oxidoreductase
MEALVGLREQGKIRAIGLSNFSCEQVATAREFGPIHCLQSSFSMVARRAAEDLVPFCREHSMGVLAYSPLAKGLLTGKFREKDTFDGVRARDPDFIGERYLRHLRMLESLRPIAETYDKTLAQLVINWTASQPGITAPVVGAKRASQVLENAGGVGWSIRDEDRLRIDRILQDAQGES